MQDTIGENMSSESKCPVLGGPHRHTAIGTASNQHWWPNQLNLKILHQNSPLSDPMGKEFNYAEEFATLDLDALKKDIDALISSDSQASSRPPAKPSGAEGILEFLGRCRSSSLARSPSRLASLASGSLDRTSTPCAAG